VRCDGPTFGLWYDFRQRPPLGDYARFFAECLEEIEEGERLGFTDVWLSEHHFVDDGLPAVTPGGRGYSGLHHEHGNRDERVAPPDAPSPAGGRGRGGGGPRLRGRFTHGVGQGYVQHEFEALGFNRKNRPSLFEEGVEVIRRAWEEGRTGYEGKRCRFEDLPFAPRPERKLPIFFGAFAEPAIDCAARMADGFLASAGGGAFGETYRKVQEALKRHGREDEDFPYVASGVAFVHEDAGLAREIVAPAIAYQRTRYAEWGTDRGKPKPEPIRPEDLPW
jgi:alkanesulfonate monooxygenase SsuD/methylene tetrahydromethanopterin reductase-like flavin-dependent oxidoreductase (luciferase family)